MISGELLQILIDNPGMKIELTYSDRLNGLIYTISILEPKYERIRGFIQKYYYDDVVDSAIESGIEAVKKYLKFDIDRGEK